MFRKGAVTMLALLGVPLGLMLAFDALLLRSRPIPLSVYDTWVCIGAATLTLLLAVWGLRVVLRGRSTKCMFVSRGTGIHDSVWSDAQELTDGAHADRHALRIVV